MNNRPTGTRSAPDRFARQNTLIELIAELKEQEAIGLIKDLLASGVDPTRVMDVCIQGLYEVGKRFEQRQYFISALIMAGDIMRQATEIMEINFLQRKSGESKGVILLGTIQGDIHDLGKNLFGILARCDGFQVIDLGVDVPPERFLEAARKVKPDFVGISCLLTSVLPELKSAVDLIRNDFQEHNSRAIIGGSCIDEHIFNHVQSDYWADSAVSGLTIVKEVLSTRPQKS